MQPSSQLDASRVQNSDPRTVRQRQNAKHTQHPLGVADHLVVAGMEASAARWSLPGGSRSSTVPRSASGSLIALGAAPLPVRGLPSDRRAEVQQSHATHCEQPRVGSPSAVLLSAIITVQVSAGTAFMKWRASVRVLPGKPT